MRVQGKWAFVGLCMIVSTQAHGEDLYCNKYPNTEFCINKEVTRTERNSVIVDSLADVDSTEVEAESSGFGTGDDSNEEPLCSFNPDSLLYWPITDLEPMETWINQELLQGFSYAKDLESNELTSMQKKMIRSKLKDFLNHLVNDGKKRDFGKWMIKDVREEDMYVLTPQGARYKKELMQFVEPWNINDLVRVELQMQQCGSCQKKTGRRYRRDVYNANVADLGSVLLPNGDLLTVNWKVTTQDQIFASSVRKFSVQHLKGMVTEIGLYPIELIDSAGRIDDTHSDPVFCRDNSMGMLNRFGTPFPKKEYRMEVTLALE